MSIAVQHYQGWAAIDVGTPVSAGELREALDALTGERTLRVALLRGDLAAVTGWSGEDSRWLWRDLPLPVVHAFDGDVAGDAAHIALACDIRVCGTSASLTIPAGDGYQQHRLAQVLPASTKIAPGEQLAATDLLSNGLVAAIAPGPAEEATRLCGVIATRGPVATRLAKEAIWRGLDMPLEQGLRFETDLTLLLQTTKDRAEGVRAFMEKRTPQFEGD